MTEPAPPLQNRVTPEGEIVAVRARGTLMGNRGGTLHDCHRRLGTRRWVSQRWICCLITFKDRQRAVMAPGRYTELFFLDEATALSAGHRPCFECRRDEAIQFARLFARVHGLTHAATASFMDRILHRERLDAAGRQRRHTADIARVPDGAFVRWLGHPHLVCDGMLLAWSHTGYGRAQAIPRRGDVEVLTPATIVAILATGWRPRLHSTARNREQHPR